MTWLGTIPGAPWYIGPAYRLPKRPTRRRRTKANFPRMKVRGGRRRARAREQRMWAYTRFYLSIDHSTTAAMFAARMSVDHGNFWQLPDDPFDPAAWRNIGGLA